MHSDRFSHYYRILLHDKIVGNNLVQFSKKILAGKDRNIAVLNLRVNLAKLLVEFLEKIKKGENKREFTKVIPKEASYEIYLEIKPKIWKKDSGKFRK